MWRLSCRCVGVGCWVMWLFFIFLKCCSSFCGPGLTESARTVCTSASGAFCPSPSRWKTWTGAGFCWWFRRWLPGRGRWPWLFFSWRSRTFCGQASTGFWLFFRAGVCGSCGGGEGGFIFLSEGGSTEVLVLEGDFFASGGFFEGVDGAVGFVVLIVEGYFFGDGLPADVVHYLIYSRAIN